MQNKSREASERERSNRERASEHCLSHKYNSLPFLPDAQNVAIEVYYELADMLQGVEEDESSFAFLLKKIAEFVKRMKETRVHRGPPLGEQNA